MAKKISCSINFVAVKSSMMRSNNWQSGLSKCDEKKKNENFKVKNDILFNSHFCKKKKT